MEERYWINTAQHAIGEVKIADGLASMCLGYRSYGGGGGTLWATPAEAVEFIVHGRRLMGAYRGINKLIESETTRKLIYPVLMCDPSLGQGRPDVYHTDNALMFLEKIFN